MVRVKICGVTNWADAKAALDAGAAAIGLNFYAPSPRSVTPAQAWSIVRRLPPFVDSVGVFVNWGFSAMMVLAYHLRLHALQLHGAESPLRVSACAARHPVIKAFRMGKGFHLAMLRRYPAAVAFLLDSSTPGLWGGTGRKSDWSIAKRATQFGRIILAGGIAPENVADAIRTVRPYAVDVASGVESQPGKKDHAKLRELMREVERANRELERH